LGKSLLFFAHQGAIPSYAAQRPRASTSNRRSKHQKLYCIRMLECQKRKLDDMLVARAGRAEVFQLPNVNIEIRRDNNIKHTRSLP
jgi:hypothetical protein